MKAFQWLNVLRWGCWGIRLWYECSCEPVSLTVWSKGRRHKDHWRDEKSHLLGYGQVEFTRGGDRERRRQIGKEGRSHRCLPHHDPLCLYRGLDVHIPLWHPSCWVCQRIRAFLHMGNARCPSMTSSDHFTPSSSSPFHHHWLLMVRLFYPFCYPYKFIWLLSL